MNLFAAFMLIVWVPVVMLVFSSMPPRKAVANLFVTAWLFLPFGGFDLPGLPDYTKMMATVVGILACVMVFDQSSFFSFRFRWFDLPVVCWCFGAFFTAISNDHGAYEGASAFLDELVNWGLPYLIGRIYFKDTESFRDLAQAIVIGGLCYIPFCLSEVRLSPFLAGKIYGIHRWEGMRYGGYRPKVFLSTSLETGMWMANAALVTFLLWSFGTIKVIRGVTAGKLVLASMVTAVLCKSTGALVLLTTGLACCWISKKTKRNLVLWLLVAIPPTYCLVRTFDIWALTQVVDVARAAFGEERARSFEFRIEMERLLADHALERPALGWGRFTVGSVMDASGKTLTIADGFWIIALGVHGIIGLVCLLAMFTMPMVKILRSHPISTWGDPKIGPVVALGLMMTLTMMDFLSNAMLNPIYPLIIGGLLSYTPDRRAAGLDEAEEALGVAAELTAEGRMAEAHEEFLRAIELSSGDDDDNARRVHAEAFAGIGQASMTAGRIEDAVDAFRDALKLRDDLAASQADDDAFIDLAIAREDYGRALAEAGAIGESIQERKHALGIWDALAKSRPKDADYRERWVNSLNDLAWLLATETLPGDPSYDAALALDLAEESIRLAPDHEASWNTLGVARYRAGDWAGAIEALERSALAAEGGRGTAFDHYFLAMAWNQIGHNELAAEWLERGVAWTARHRPGHPALERFLLEARSLVEG